MNIVEDDRLLELASAAREHAYAPYSHYKVGAALLTSSGATYAGCNVENSVYPAGICAERTAIGAAISAGERSIVRLVVIADSYRPVPPCGICRQVIAELAPNATILLANLHDERQETTPQELLPHSFGVQDLESARG